MAPLQLVPQPPHVALEARSASQPLLSSEPALQCARPAAHSTAHSPALQDTDATPDSEPYSAVQLRPHAPQEAVVLAVSMHSPAASHHVRPLAQRSRQEPPLPHSWEAGQSASLRHCLHVSSARSQRWPLGQEASDKQCLHAPWPLRGGTRRAARTQPARRLCKKHERTTNALQIQQHITGAAQHWQAQQQGPRLP